MTTVNPEFIEYCRDQIAQLTPLPITIRRLFGAHALYAGGKIFGFIEGETLYFKVNDQTKKIYEELESRPFEYEKNGKKYAMRYYVVPENFIDDTGQLNSLLDDALRVAQEK